VSHLAGADRVIRGFDVVPDPVEALGQLGRTAEAKEALDKAVSLAPAAFDMYVRKRVPWFRPEDHAHLVEGLRKAGWEG
jgi:adenylate cyclase